MKKLLLLSLIFITQPVFAEYMCEDTTDYYAVYTPYTYTCNTGQYLPANTLGCVSCPSGWTCSGGTFAFNTNEYQGAEIDIITTNTMNNICADNFPIDLYATYTPNTITITWADIDPNYAGQNNEGTTTYGSDVRTPVKAATKPGKTFVGWKFVKPQQ